MRSDQAEKRHEVDQEQLFGKGRVAAWKHEASDAEAEYACNESTDKWQADGERGRALEGQGDCSEKGKAGGKADGKTPGSADRQRLIEGLGDWRC